MKFLLDEHVDPELGAYLENHGHEVEHVLEDRRGDDDRELLEHARNQGSMVVTRDDDFLRQAGRKEHPGIVFLTRHAPVRHLGAGIDRKMEELDDEIRNSVLFLPE